MSVQAAGRFGAVVVVVHRISTEAIHAIPHGLSVDLLVESVDIDIMVFAVSIHFKLSAFE